jgi:hypothetical protein
MRATYNTDTTLRATCTRGPQFTVAHIMRATSTNHKCGGNIGRASYTRALLGPPKKFYAAGPRCHKLLGTGKCGVNLFYIIPTAYISFPQTNTWSVLTDKRFHSLKVSNYLILLNTNLFSTIGLS